MGANTLHDVDLVMLGSPTQGWRPTPAMLAFLATIAPHMLDGVDVACFDTRFHWPRFLTGSAAQTMVRQLHKQGALLLTGPQSFFVTGRAGPLEAGELKRASLGHIPCIIAWTHHPR